MEADNTYEPEPEGTRMPVPYITSFFWCVSLHTGSKIVSLMHLAWSIAVVLLCVIMAVEAHSNIGTVDDAEDHLYTSWFIIISVIAVFSAVHVLLASTLVYGVFNRNARAVRVWVLVMVALYAAALLYVVCAPIAYGFRATGSEIFVCFLEGLLLFAFLGYCILCVNSYYLMLKSTDEVESPAKTDF